MIKNNLPWKSLSDNDKGNKTDCVRKIFAVLFTTSLALNIYFIFVNKEPEARSFTFGAANPELQSAKEIFKRKTVSIHSVVEPDALEPGKTLNIKNISFSGAKHFDGKKVRFIHFKIKKSLNHTMCSILSQAKGCEILSAYISRLLVWFIDINKQMRNGDSVNLIYEESDGEDNFRILKLKYRSRFFRTSFEANYYKYPGPRYGAFFDSDGKAIVPRIMDKETPIRNYIEITSLPGDYRKGRFRGHSGTDFKAPTGTSVYSGFNGRVTRKNWNIKANGYSLEIDHPNAKVKTRYLHLSKTLVQIGQFIKQGQKIAESGNSGRSFAPHLHYELLSRSPNPTVKNPFKSKAHKIYYLQVPPQRKEEFLQTVALYNSAVPSS